MTYHLFRNLLFMLPPELAHSISLNTLSCVEKMGILGCVTPKTSASHPVKVMNIEFPNRVGLAAGLDKNGAHIDALSKLGFGFIEVGTITPKPQIGNPKPRLFRLPEHQAIINRMGFNNDGVEGLLANLKNTRYKGILGINIGKNATTAIDHAVDDYLYCLERVYEYASYVTVNLSSPNTPGLRGLQMGEMFSSLLDSLKNKQRTLHTQHRKYVPLVVKIAPDLEDEAVISIAKTLIDFEVDGVIATNTTITRAGVSNHRLANEAGGLSGKPLFDQSTRVVSILSSEISGKLPIIAAGGICSGEDAAAKIRAGASLVQIYTGFIYQGPQLIADAISHI